MKAVHIKGAHGTQACKTGQRKPLGALLCVDVQAFHTVDVERRCTRCMKRYATLLRMADTTNLKSH